jgi:hypothetical protein
VTRWLIVLATGILGLGALALALGVATGWWFAAALLLATAALGTWDLLQRRHSILRNYPVQSVTSVKADPAYGFGADSVVPTTAYVVHSDRGVIQSVTGRFARGPRAVQVVYATATGAVPDDVKEAYALLIGHWYRMAKTAFGQNYEMLETLIDTSGEKDWPWSVSAGEPLPPGVLQLLQPYRVPAA